MPSKKKIVPTEFEIRGVLLRDLVTPDFIKSLEKNLGKIAIVNVGFITEKEGELIMLWHPSSKHAEDKIVTVNTGEEQVIEALAKALGIGE